jgi:S-adenosylmethionine synthetase
MKVLVAGGSGLVGRCLIAELEKRGIAYIATYNSRPIPNGHKLNFESEAEVRAFLEKEAPTVCVNCIVQRQTDVCEKDWAETKRVNIDIVDILSRACEDVRVFFVHISTDYVFDGSEPPYTYRSPTNPLQNYGISKLVAEQRVKANCPLHCILRVPVLYCDEVESLEENAVTLIGKKVFNQLQSSQEDDYSIRRPVYIPDFCKFIVSCCDEERYGTFHYFNPVDAYTKYQIAKMIGDLLEKPTDHIRPSDSTVNVASRPRDTQLMDTRFPIQDFPCTPLADGLARCFEAYKHPMQFGPDCLVLMDLDGTLLDTDKVQYEAYRLALRELGRDLSWPDFQRGIHTSHLDTVFSEMGLTQEEMKLVRSSKTAHMKTLIDIQPIPGAAEFVEACLTAGTNIVVVTNTSREIVEHYKAYVPFLNKLTQWVCKDDYVAPKPSPESYELAVQKFSNGERYRVGFENTKNGIVALKHITPCIYTITDPSCSYFPMMKREDVFLIRNYHWFLDIWSKDTERKSS